MDMVLEEVPAGENSEASFQKARGAELRAPLQIMLLQKND